MKQRLEGISEGTSRLARPRAECFRFVVHLGYRHMGAGSSSEPLVGESVKREGRSKTERLWKGATRRNRRKTPKRGAIRSIPCVHTHNKTEGGSRHGWLLKDTKTFLQMIYGNYIDAHTSGCLQTRGFRALGKRVDTLSIERATSPHGGTEASAATNCRACFSGDKFGLGLLPDPGVCV